MWMPFVSWQKEAVMPDKEMNEDAENSEWQNSGLKWPSPGRSAEDANTISLKPISPARYEGEITDRLQEMREEKAC